MTELPDISFFQLRYRRLFQRSGFPLTFAMAVITAFFSALSCADSPKFSATVTNDPMDFGATYSKDARFYTHKGSVQISIIERAHGSKIGDICCLKDGEDSSEYFLRSEKGEDRLLQYLHVEHLSRLSVFDHSGKKVAESLITDSGSKPLVVVSRSKNRILVVNGKTLIVYDAALRVAARYALAQKIQKLRGADISPGATSVMLSGDGVIVLVNLLSGSESLLKSCPAFNRDYTIRIASQGVDHKFVALDEFGNGCWIDGDNVTAFQLALDRGIVAAYAKENILYVVTQVAIGAYQATSWKKLGSFDLVPYYEKKFGRHPNENPTFTDCEFNDMTDTFFLRSQSTGSFFEISVNK